MKIYRFHGWIRRFSAASPHVADRGIEIPDPSVKYISRLNPRIQVREAKDNWLGEPDRAERRKLQNRLHQRAWRTSFHLAASELCADHKQAGNVKKRYLVSPESTSLRDPGMDMACWYCKSRRPEVPLILGGAQGVLHPRPQRVHLE